MRNKALKTAAALFFSTIYTPVKSYNREQCLVHGKYSAKMC